jgi:hypothetical protein
MRSNSNSKKTKQNKTNARFARTLGKRSKMLKQNAKAQKIIVKGL